jgi:hypothetical protein
LQNFIPVFLQSAFADAFDLAQFGLVFHSQARDLSKLLIREDRVDGDTLLLCYRLAPLPQLHEDGEVLWGQDLLVVHSVRAAFSRPGAAHCWPLEVLHGQRPIQ